MRRLAPPSLLICACALALAGGSAEAASAPIAAGDYEGAPVLDTGGSYSKAIFSLAKESGKRTIVATEAYDGIYYPDAGECDDQLVPLAADAVAVSSTARFKIRDKTTLDNAEILVTWKGHWTAAKRIAGTITIKSGECTSTQDWAARKVH